MAHQKIKLPKLRSVIVHGEEIEDVIKVIPPSAKKPYWTFIMGKDSLILATGDVCIKRSPDQTVVRKNFSKQSQ